MFHRFNWAPVSASRNALTAEYEPVQPFYLTALAEAAACRTFLDVGANIGAYALFATLIPTIERVICFEANPEAARELRRNVELNKAPVEIQAVAVSDRPGELSFGIVGDYAGNNAVIETSIHDTALFKRHISVPAIVLDSLLGLPAPICLKIDVEGHELPVLNGARAILQSPCVIQAEDYGFAVGEFLGQFGFSRLTSIGPDHYYSNIPGLSPLEIYEAAMRRLIDSNHEAASSRVPDLTLRWGDFMLRIAGSSATKLRQARKRFRRPFG